MTTTLESEVEPMDLSVVEERPLGGGVDAEMVSRTEPVKSPAGSSSTGDRDGGVRESGTAVENAATAAEAVRSVGLARRSSRSPPHSNKASTPLIGAAYSARHGLIPLPITTATNKQCWVALNKGIVYDLVESAMRDAGIGEDVDYPRASSAEPPPGRQPSPPVATTHDRAPEPSAVSCDSKPECTGRNSQQMEETSRESPGVASPGKSRSDGASINNKPNSGGSVVPGSVQTDKLAGRTQSPSIAKSQECQRQSTQTRPSSPPENNKHSVSNLAGANPAPMRRFCNAHSISDLLKDNPVSCETVRVKEEETNVKENIDGLESSKRAKSEKDGFDGKDGSVVSPKDIRSDWSEESPNPGEAGQASASRKHAAQVSMCQDVVPRGQTLSTGVGGASHPSSPSTSLGKRRRVLDDLTAHLLRHKVARSSTPTTSQAMPTTSGTPSSSSQLSHSFYESKTILVNITDSGRADPKVMNSLAQKSSEAEAEDHAKSTVNVPGSPLERVVSDSKATADIKICTSDGGSAGSHTSSIQHTSSPAASNVVSGGVSHTMMSSSGTLSANCVMSEATLDSDRCAETVRSGDSKSLLCKPVHGKTHSSRENEGIKTEEGPSEVEGGRGIEFVDRKPNSPPKDSIGSGGKVGWSNVVPTSVSFGLTQNNPGPPSSGGNKSPSLCSKRSPGAMSRSSSQRPSPPPTGTLHGPLRQMPQTFSNTQKSMALPLTSRPAPNRFLSNAGHDSSVRAKPMRRQTKDVPTRARATFNPNKHGIVAISLNDKSSLYGQEAPRTSPRLGWIAVSKEDVHTIIDSMMESFMAEERSMAQTRASRANTPSGEVCENDSDLPLNLSFSTAPSDQTLKPIPGFNKSTRILKESEQSSNELCDSDNLCDSPKDESTDPKCSPGDWLSCDKDELRQQDFVKDTENLDVDMTTKKAFKWKSCLLERLNVESVSETMENTSQPVRRQAVARRTKRTSTNKLK